MNELITALGPVRRRIRRNRALEGAAFGFAAGAAGALCLLVLSLLFPIPDKWLWAAGILLCSVLLASPANALRPVKNRDAALAADRCGLKERTVTALEAPEIPEDGGGIRRAMCLAQREDACRALKSLDFRQIRPRPVKRILLFGAAGCLLCAGMLLIPNVQDARAAETKALRETLDRASAEMDEAGAADEEKLPEKEKAELRRIREDLKRDLARSRDTADALVAVDRAEKRVEEIRSRTAGDAQAAATQALADALREAGLDSLADSVLSGDETAVAEALAGMDAAAAEALSRAAEGMEGAAGEAAQAMASAAQGGDPQQAASQAMQALNASGSPGASATEQALSSLKATLGGASAGQGQNSSQGGSSGTGGNNPNGPAGGGAGRGTTNEEQKGSGGKSQSGASGGNQPAEFREGKYETIYDPEKVETASRDVMTEQNRLGEDSVQIEAGEGKGTLEGSLPWGSVIGEYAESESRSAESENLTGEQREWVSEYYRLLTEQSEQE